MREELADKLERRCSFWPRILRTLDAELLEAGNIMEDADEERRSAMEELQEELLEHCFAGPDHLEPESFAEESRLLDDVSTAYALHDQTRAQQLLKSFLDNVHIEVFSEGKAETGYSMIQQDSMN